MTNHFTRRRRSSLAVVDDAVARCDIATVDLPHVVYVYDRVLGVPCALGPFPSPVAACAYAEQFVRDVVGCDGDASTLLVRVIPLELPYSQASFPKRRWSRWSSHVGARSLGSRVRAGEEAQ